MVVLHINFVQDLTLFQVIISLVPAGSVKKLNDFNNTYVYHLQWEESYVFFLTIV